MSTARPIDLLRTIRPFSLLSDEVRAAVLDRCQTITVVAGTRVVGAGEIPAALSIVVSGQVRVLRGHDTAQPVSIDVLGRGALVGETLLEGTPAAFSILALADCELLRLTADDLTRLIAAEAELDAVLREHVLAWTRPATTSAPPPSPAAAPAPAAPAAEAPSAPAAAPLRNTVAPFIPYLRPLYPIAAELVGASLVIQLLALMLPLFARFVVDEIIASSDATWLESATLAIGAVVGLSLAAGAARRYLAEFISEQIDARVVADLYRHVLRLPMQFFETRHAGEIVGAFDDLTGVSAFLTRTGVGVVVNALAGVLSLWLMLRYSALLTAFAVGFVAAEIATLSIVTPRLQRRVGTLASEQAGSDSLLIESLAGLRTIKLLTMEPFIRWRLHDRLARLTNTSLAALRYRTLARVASDTVTSVGTLAVLVIGAALVLRGRLTIGELVAFGILTQGLTAPLAQLVAGWDALQATTRSLSNINAILSHPAESPLQPQPDQVVLHKLQGHVRFDAVSFRYERDGPPVLRDVSFECYGGQRVAILGRSGSGKSTLVKLLLGLYAPTSGEIAVDGSPLTDIWLPALRRQIGVVLQDTALFRGSIRANIGHTMPSAPLGEVISAATLVNAHRFIAALPAGYDTELDDNGANLSGGQRQQIAIARALLPQPRMIILDEATSNVDNELARLLQQNLDIAFKDATVFMTTQRLETARRADLILVLEQGSIVEQGTHDELMAREGAYHGLMLAQAV